jgi:hypothetical protein
MTVLPDPDNSVLSEALGEKQFLTKGHQMAVQTMLAFSSVKNLLPPEAA